MGLGVSGFERWARLIPRASGLTAYTLALATLAGAVAARFALDEVAGGPMPPYITLFPAILIAGLVGGFRVAMVTMIAGLVLAWYLWVPWFNSFRVGSWHSAVSLLTYTINGLLIASISGGARALLDRAIAEQRERARAARETVHRVKNLIAVVQAISHKVAAHSESLDDYQRDFNQRLAALGIAQNALVRADWRDTHVAPLLEEALAPFRPNPRLTIAGGPDVSVPNQFVNGLCLALYELCTNSLKYGALSPAGGAVTLSWRVENGAVALSWDERAAITPPDKKSKHGLGSGLIENALNRRQGTKVEYALSAEGVRALFKWPREAD